MTDNDQPDVYLAEFAKLTTRRGWAWVCGRDKCASLPSHERYAVGPFRTARAAERDFLRWFSTDPEAKAHTVARLPEGMVAKDDIDLVTGARTKIVNH